MGEYNPPSPLITKECDVNSTLWICVRWPPMCLIGAIHWINAIREANGTTWWWCLRRELCWCLTEFSYYSYCRKATVWGGSFSFPPEPIVVKLLSLKKGLLVNIGCYILILGKNVWYVHIEDNRLALSNTIKTSCKQCNKHILDLYLVLMGHNMVPSSK